MRVEETRPVAGKSAICESRRRGRARTQQRCSRRIAVDRYYDPSTSQFLSIDPDVAETGQPYAYTADDPLNLTDPLGLGPGLNPQKWSFKKLPRARNYKLERALKELFQESDREPGGTARALRVEAKTGKPAFGNRFHDVKGAQSQARLENIIEEQPLSRQDSLVARAALQDLSAAQDEWDTAAVEGKFSVGSGSGQLSQGRYDDAVNRFGPEVGSAAVGANPAESNFYAESTGGSGGADTATGSAEAPAEVPDIP